MNSFSRAIINSTLYIFLFKLELCMLFAPAWPTWPTRCSSSHAAGQNQPSTVVEGKDHSCACWLAFPAHQVCKAALLPILHISFSLHPSSVLLPSALPHPAPVPTPVTNSAANALPASLAPIPNAAVMELPAFQARVLSVRWCTCIFHCYCLHFRFLAQLNDSS